MRSTRGRATFHVASVSVRLGRVFPGSMMDFPLTLAHVAARTERLFASVEVVARKPDRSLERSSWGAVIRRARRLAAALTRAGLREGDRVATLQWNGLAHLEAYLGIPLAGGVCHPLNLRLHPDELGYIASHARDRFLLVDDVLLPVLESIRAKAPFERIFVVQHTNAPLPAGCESYTSLLASAGSEFVVPRLDERAAASMCYTSGTTGRPKGVLYTHRSIVLHSLSQALTGDAPIGQRDCVFAVAPMFHVNSWGFPYTAALMGAKLVLPGPHLDPESLLDLLDQERVTLTSGVPTIWVALRDALRAQPRRWRLEPGLRAIVGGSALPESLLREMAELGVQLFHCWGMTETSPIGTYGHVKSTQVNFDDEAKFKILARQGYASPLVELRHVDDAGRVLPWDDESIGELQCRGPWVAGSYFDNHESEERWTADGWFRTGDVVAIDSEGVIRIVDRSKDLVKSGGEWISSVALENALMAHAAVREAAVIGVPHPKWQERPIAVVALRPGASASAQELQQFLAARFAKWQVPDAVVFVETLPRTGVGKVRKTELRERYREFPWS